MKKIALITGASSGIGKETAIGLAKADFDLILLGRNKEKISSLIEYLKKINSNSNYYPLLANLGSLKAVNNAASIVSDEFKKLDILINNAGTISSNRLLSAENYEMTFAVNHLSHFFLTGKLLPLLKNSEQARIINVSSEMHQIAKLNLNDLQLHDNYSAIRAYSQSKLLNILFTYKLAEKLEGSNITVNCLHPGTVRTRFDSDIHGMIKFIWSMYKPFMISPVKGAKTLIYLSVSNDVDNISGKYFSKCKTIKSSNESYNRQFAEKLWQESEKMTGISY